MLLLGIAPWDGARGNAHLLHVALKLSTNFHYSYHPVKTQGPLQPLLKSSRKALHDHPDNS